MRLAMAFLPLAFLLAAAALSSGEESGEASGLQGGAALQPPGESPPAAMEQASEGQAPSRGATDGDGTEAADEGQAGEEETALEPLELQGDIRANANVSLPQDI